MLRRRGAKPNLLLAKYLGSYAHASGYFQAFLLHLTHLNQWVLKRLWNRSCILKTFVPDLGEDS